LVNILDSLTTYMLCIFISFSIIYLIFEEVKSGIKNIKKELIENGYTGFNKFMYILSRVLFGKDD